MNGRVNLYIRFERDIDVNFSFQYELYLYHFIRKKNIKIIAGKNLALLLIVNIHLVVKPDQKTSHS